MFDLLQFTFSCKKGLKSRVLVPSCTNSQMLLKFGAFFTHYFPNSLVDLWSTKIVWRKLTKNLNNNNYLIINNYFKINFNYIKKIKFHASRYLSPMIIEFKKIINIDYIAKFLNIQIYTIQYNYVVSVDV